RAREPRKIHEGVYHRRFASPKLENSVRDEPRVRQNQIHILARGRATIPPLETPTKNMRRDPNRERCATRTEVIFEAIPDVAHWRMDIGNMGRALGFPNSLRDRMRRRNNQIESAQIELFDELRHHRKIVPIIRDPARLVLKPRRMD